MADPFTWAAIGATVIGAGVSAYGSYSQGKQTAAIADFNARQQEQASRQQLLISQYEQNMAAREAEANRALGQAQVNAALVNADQLDNEAEAQRAQGRESVGRTREESARLQARTRAAIAGSGVVAAGTPLEVLAENAKNAELAAQDDFYLSSLDAQRTQRQADLSRYDAKVQGFGVSSQFALSQSANSIRGAAAKVTASNSRRRAEIERLAGSYARKQGTLSAIGTGISGAGDAYSTYKSTI